MSPQRLDEILRNYRIVKARLVYIKSEIEMLERHLRMCQMDIINDRVSLSQAITGMPHGSGVGDPTGRLAADIASGAVTPFVEQIQEELEKWRKEYAKVIPQVRTVEIVLEALGDREREVLVLKIIDNRDWADTVNQMNLMHNNSYSKRSLQRLLDRAMEKAYHVVK